MKLVQMLAVMVLCSTVGTAWPTQGQEKKKFAPPELKGKTLQQMFDELLPGMNAFGQQQQQWQNICFQAGAAGNEAARAEACQLMIAKLGPMTPNGTRLWLLQQLERLGRGESVAPVSALLTDKDDLVRDAAVRCLANNPTKEATARLIAALPALGGKGRVGLINALGYRGAASAVAAVARELASTDAAVAAAAARMLGKIGTAEAARELAAARAQAKGQARLVISDAYLRCADRRLQEGQTAEAAAIYRELHKGQEARAIRLAALQGALKAAGAGAGQMILGILGGDDADGRAIAVAAIETIDPDAVKALAAGIDKLSPAGQVLVLGALAARGDRSQAAVALAAARSGNDNVRRAGIVALGRLGDGAVVPALLDIMFTNASLASAAKDSLARLSVADVDQKIIAALQGETKAGRRVLLIAILEGRRTVAAVPVLLQDAQSSDAVLRSSAMSALRLLASPKHVPELVKALLKADQGRERDEAANTVVAVCSQVAEPQRRAAPILGALTEETKTTLLPLLGRLGGAKAQAVIKAALAGGSGEQYEAALRGLCSWPDPSVSEDLLQLAQTAKDQGQRQQALRALIRVNALATEGANLAKLAMLKKAMELATRNEDKKLVFDGLGNVKEIDTLRYVLPYLDDKELAQLACRSIVELAHSKKLREPNRAAFHQALDRVIAICRDKGLIDRAQKYKQGQ